MIMKKKTDMEYLRSLEKRLQEAEREPVTVRPNKPANRLTFKNFILFEAIR